MKWKKKRIRMWRQLMNAWAVSRTSCWCCRARAALGVRSCHFGLVWFSCACVRIVVCLFLCVLLVCSCVACSLVVGVRCFVPPSWRVGETRERQAQHLLALSRQSNFHRIVLFRLYVLSSNSFVRIDVCSQFGACSCCSTPERQQRYKRWRYFDLFKKKIDQKKDFVVVVL